jgi:carbamate kinase
MGPKAEACARFVEATGGRAAIGALADIPAVLAGEAGTQVHATGPDLVHQVEEVLA